MLTEMDEEEAEQSKGATSNSASIRCLLSLRNGTALVKARSPFPSSATPHALGAHHPMLLCPVIYSNGVDGPSVTAAFPRGLRVVCQLHEPCPFLHAASIVGPDERSCLFPMDLSKTINVLMFYCAAKPGLSRVIMQLFNFDGVAIRCRKARHCRAGPKGGSVGWLVGKTMRHAMLNSCWVDGIIIGVADVTFGDGSGVENDYEKNGGGVCGDPDRVIVPTDFVIFVSSTSSPFPFRSFMLPNFKNEALAILKGSQNGRQTSSRNLAASTSRGGAAAGAAAARSRVRKRRLAESQTDVAKHGEPQRILLW